MTEKRQADIARALDQLEERFAAGARILAERVRVLDPDEWAAMLLAGPKLTRAELATSLRAAIERGATGKRERCAGIAKEHAGGCGYVIRAAIEARGKP